MVNLVIGILGLDLNLSDLKNPEQWGKTSSGRIVLLDYGLSDDIYNEYY
jgi:hypothetical protein